MGKSKNGFIQELRQLIDPLDVYELKQLIELLLETVQESNKILTKDSRACLVTTMIDQVRSHRPLCPSDTAVRRDSKYINQIVNLLEIMIVKDNPDFWKDYPELAVSVKKNEFVISHKAGITTIAIDEQKSEEIYHELQLGEVLNKDGSINKEGLTKLFFDKKFGLSEQNQVHQQHVLDVLKYSIQHAVRQWLFMEVQPNRDVSMPFSSDQARGGSLAVVRPKVKEIRQKAYKAVFFNFELGIDARKSEEIYWYFKQSLGIINKDNTVNKNWLKNPKQKKTDSHLTNEQLQHGFNVLRLLVEQSVPEPSSSGAGRGGAASVGRGGPGVPGASSLGAGRGGAVSAGRGGPDVPGPSSLGAGRGGAASAGRGGPVPGPSSFGAGRGGAVSAGRGGPVCRGRLL